jgi:hypothetical protein
LTAPEGGDTLRNHPKKLGKMEKKPIEVILDPSPTSESLWDDFEKTGSIQAFMLFRQKTESSSEWDKSQAPS